MVVAGQPEEIAIEVSSRILRHIGRGIYRTPAAALKELVSNSYDARATEVTINTGYPVFETMVVRDNGDGMTREDFIRFIKQIGLTEKVAGDTIKMPEGQKDRKVIGHYGIGLLAIGQLAKKAIITSKKEGNNGGFAAELDFEQFETREVQGLQRATVKDEETFEINEKQKVKEQGSETKLPIGTCLIKRIRFRPEDRRKHFTEVELREVRLEVSRKLSGEIRDARNPDAIEFQRYSGSFEDLLALLREEEWGIKQGQYPYEMLCWELGVYCPVPYREIGLFREGGPLRHIYELASWYDFSLKVDGFTVTKPFEAVFFDDQENPVERVFTWSNEMYMPIDESGLKVTGYLIYKRQIRPKRVQGILVREGGVAVGSYDTTYLEYPNYEGWKFSQLTGELFAEGLSGALNIDRNSFNETDDRYIALAAWLHKKLQSEVFPIIKEIGKEVSARPRAENIEMANSVLSKLAGEVESTCRRISFEDLGKSGPLLEIRGNRLLINWQHPDGSGSSTKTDKLLFIAALVLKGKITPSEVEELQSMIKNLRFEVKKG